MLKWIRRLVLTVTERQTRQGYRLRVELEVRR